MQSKQWEKYTVAPLVATHKHTLPANSNDKDTRGFSPASKPVIQLDVTSWLSTALGFNPETITPVVLFVLLKQLASIFISLFFFSFLEISWQTSVRHTHRYSGIGWVGGVKPLSISHTGYDQPTNQPKHTIKKICCCFFLLKKITFNMILLKVIHRTKWETWSVFTPPHRSKVKPDWL